MPITFTSRGAFPWRSVISPAPRDIWSELIRNDRRATFFQDPAWVDQVCVSGGYQDVSRLYETNRGSLVLLPLLRKAHLAGAVSQQGSLPAGWGSGGLLSNAPLEAEVVSAIVADLRGDSRVLSTLLQPGPLTDAFDRISSSPGVKAIPRRAHVLDLAGGLPVVWSQRFTSTARTAVRKAQRAGVVIEHDETGALLPEFWELRRKSITRWAMQQNEPLRLAHWRAARRDPPLRVRTMVNVVPSGFHLYIARHLGKPVAGILVLHGQAASYLQGAMDKELAGPVRANYLLQYVAIENACDAGCGWYDFGETGSASNLAQFKTRFGARPVSYSDFRIERLPLTEAGRVARTIVKRAVGYRSPPPLPKA